MRTVPTHVGPPKPGFGRRSRPPLRSCLYDEPAPERLERRLPRRVRLKRLHDGTGCVRTYVSHLRYASELTCESFPSILHERLTKKSEAMCVTRSHLAFDLRALSAPGATLRNIFLAVLPASDDTGCHVSVRHVFCALAGFIACGVLIVGLVLNLVDVRHGPILIRN